MRPLAVVALNIATVVVALVAYDMLRAPPETDVPIVVDLDAPEPGADLLERVDRLERDRGRTRRSAPDQTILYRLAALESASQTPVAEGRAQPDRAAPPTATETPALGSLPAHADDALAPAEIKRFRQLQAAVRRNDMVAKNKHRIEATLDALSLNLTVAERTKVHSAYAAFQPRFGEIWNEVKREAQATVKALEADSEDEARP